MRGVGVDCDRIDRMKVVHGARERGLSITSAGPDAIRMVPPLIISEAQIDDALERLRGADHGSDIMSGCRHFISLDQFDNTTLKRLLSRAEEHRLGTAKVRAMTSSERKLLAMIFTRQRGHV